MEVTLIIMAFLLKGLWETEAFSVTGVVGDKVTITCTHQNAFHNVKYFCKGQCNGNDILVTSKDTEEDSSRRYRIKDEGNTFYVHIVNLKKDDSGTYWCGIDRVGLDTYNRVDLTVKEGEARNSNIAMELSSNHLVYIGVALGVVALALTMALAMFFRHRNRAIRDSSGKDRDMRYATPPVQEQHARRDITAASANEETEDGISSVFSRGEDQTEPDSLFYSSVSFSKHKGHKTPTPLTTTPTYSTIKHISAEESTVYSNV